MTSGTINERDLISASMQGSQIAYRELVHLHQKDAYRFARAMIGEGHAQHIAEDAFITMWRQMKYFRSFNMSFRERLFQLISINCEEILKKQRRHKTLLPPCEDSALNFPVAPLRYAPLTNMEHLALQMDIEEALSALPFHFRRILLLHEMGNLADTQIAHITGDSAQAIHTDLARARGFVRRHIIIHGGFFPISGEGASDRRKHCACTEYLSTLSAAADGLCTAEERRTLEQHFLSCPGCQSYYEALCAIHHGIAVLKCDVPSDMAAYIMQKIQQESTDGFSPSETSAAKKQHRSFRPAFGRFTIIGLCFALILLAYSNKLTGETEPSQEKSPPVSENQQQKISDAAPSDTATEEEQGPSAGKEETTSSFMPAGNATSPSLIPEGETYHSIQVVPASAVELLTRYSTVSFQATLIDGQTVLYYVVPTASTDSLLAAFSDAAITASAYEETDALDESTENDLFMIYLEHSVTT